MTEPHNPPDAASEGTPSPTNPGGAAAPTKPAMIRDRLIAIALAGVLLLVVALIATAPFWAALLPWAASSDPELASRFDRLDAAQQHTTQELTSAAAVLQRLDRRVATLESKAGAPGDITGLRQEIGRLTDITGDLARRIDAFDKAERGQSAADATDLALALSLLQIRDAVDLGRPFTAAYATLITLARTRPDIAAAAVPLVEPAKNGSATRAVLASRLRELAGAIAAVPAGGSEDWTDQVLARLKGLVTIRRLDSAAPVTPGSHEAAINVAQRSLAGGDLEGAVAAFDKLDGLAAETVRPWLAMARQRLTVEAALQELDGLLAAHLGGTKGAASGGPSR